MLTNNTMKVVRNVRWTPSYDLYATSENGVPSSTISLLYRVHLSQITGEHWNNASIIFSTAVTDTLDAGIPEPKPLNIRSQSDIMAIQLLPSTTANVDKGVSMYEGISFVTKSPLPIRSVVEEKITILSDGEPHKVSVVQLPFEAGITLVTVPSVQSLAYFEVSFFQSLLRC
jgi:Domain of unknown function (DUF4139)